MRRRIATAVALLLLALSATASASASTESVEVCVTLYEYGSGGTDNITWCGQIPGTLGDSNLTNNTAGLHNGCDCGILCQSSSWNDCVSRFSYSNLPANYKVKLYWDANYGFGLACLDVNGNGAMTIGGTGNDNTSSWRVEGGNCP